MKLKIFEHKSKIKTSAQKLLHFHNEPQALKKLTPFPVIIRVVKDKREGLTKGEIRLQMWMGIIPITWIARHEGGLIATSFKDVALKSPMAHWEHEHIFEETHEGTILIDRITLAHKKNLWQVFTRIAFDGIMLKLLFHYRHWKTKQCLEKQEH